MATISEKMIQKFFEILQSSKLPSELLELLNATTNHFVVVQSGTDDARKMKLSSVRGALGTFNASTNTPNLADGTALEGDSYVVSVAGTHNFGSGNKTMAVDDIIEYRNGKWIVNSLAFTKAKIIAALNYDPEAKDADTLASANSYTDYVLGLSNTRIINFNAAWDTGLTFYVVADWVFEGVTLTTQPDPVIITLNNGDVSFDRIDLIVVNKDGTVSVVEGTPSADPKKPEIDPSTQLEGTFVYIKDNATEPDGVSSTFAYNENLQVAGGEWDTSDNTGGARIDLGATTAPFSGTVHIEATAMQQFDRVTLTPPAAIAIDNFKQVNFRIQNKGVVSGTIPDFPLQVTIIGQRNNGNPDFIQITDLAQYGYDKTDTAAYQYISIPIDSKTQITDVTELRFVNAVPTGQQWGYYLDTVKIVDGVAPPVENGVTQAYVDYQDQLILDQAKAYADSIGGLGDKHYAHSQGTPNSTWTVNHGLGKFPSVTIKDSSGREIEGHVEHVDLNNTTITFNSSFSGNAYFN